MSMLRRAACSYEPTTGIAIDEESVVTGTPKPTFRTLHKPRLRRIDANVIDDPLELIVVPDPMIVRLGLPECAAAFQDSICLMRGIALQAVHDPREWAVDVKLLTDRHRSNRRLAC